MDSIESLAAWALDLSGVETHIEAEPTNTDYGATMLRIGSVVWRVRQARVTPSKPGAFVAVWRRADSGSTEPFPADDAVAGLIVFVAEPSVTGATRTGLFIFTADHLQRLRVTTSRSVPGKRGFRVYPPWCSELNAQAARTQRAQAPGFIELTHGIRSLTPAELRARLDL